jgi:rsbT antagonist protein RsbS
MRSAKSAYAAGMHIVGGFLIAPAPDGLDDAPLLLFRSELLEKVHGVSIRGALIDVSRVVALDSVTFSVLSDTAKMLELLGAPTVFVGFQPGVVAALVDLDVEGLDIRCVASLEDGLELLREQLIVKDDFGTVDPDAGPEDAPGDECPETGDDATQL